MSLNRRQGRSGSIALGAYRPVQEQTGASHNAAFNERAPIHQSAPIRKKVSLRLRYASDVFKRAFHFALSDSIMMTTFIEVRTLWTFHGDTMIHLHRTESIFTLRKLVAEMTGIALLAGGAMALASRSVL